MLRFLISAAQGAISVGYFQPAQAIQEVKAIFEAHGRKAAIQKIREIEKNFGFNSADLDWIIQFVLHQNVIHWSSTRRGPESDE